MAPLHVYLCGRLALELDELIVLEHALPARQGRRLWAYLVLRRRGPVGRDELARAIWGEDSPEAMDAALNALVSRLRASVRPLTTRLPSFTIHGEPGRYLLTLPADTFVDCERARTGLHLAEAALRGGDLGLALAESRVAMEIAARGFLPGEDAPWIEGQRQTLAEIRLHALEVTIESELRRGDPATAEREAELLLHLDPLRESGYRLMMRALAAGGNQAQAGVVLARCVRALREHAGATPSGATLRLYHAIIDETH